MYVQSDVVGTFLQRIEEVFNFFNIAGDSGLAQSKSLLTRSNWQVFLFLQNHNIRTRTVGPLVIVSVLNNVEGNISYKFSFVTVALTDGVIVRCDVNLLFSNVYCESISFYTTIVVAVGSQYKLVCTYRFKTREDNRIYSIDIGCNRIVIVNIQCIGNTLLTIRSRSECYSVGSIESLPEIFERILCGQVLIFECCTTKYYICTRTYFS